MNHVTQNNVVHSTEEPTPACSHGTCTKHGQERTQGAGQHWELQNKVKIDIILASKTMSPSSPSDAVGLLSPVCPGRTMAEAPVHCSGTCASVVWLSSPSRPPTSTSDSSRMPLTFTSKYS